MVDGSTDGTKPQKIEFLCIFTAVYPQSKKILISFYHLELEKENQLDLK